MLLNRASCFMSGTRSTSGWSGASVKAHTPMPHGSSAPTALRQRRFTLCQRGQADRGARGASHVWDLAPKNLPATSEWATAPSEEHTVQLQRANKGSEFKQQGQRRADPHLIRVQACFKRQA